MCSFLFLKVVIELAIFGVRDSLPFYLSNKHLTTHQPLIATETTETILRVRQNSPRGIAAAATSVVIVLIEFVEPTWEAMSVSGV
jgi:hypothetical protein